MAISNRVGKIAGASGACLSATSGDFAHPAFAADDIGNVIG
jgi:hypothetical protein